MKNKGKVKFIRVRGRIVPIRSKSDQVKKGRVAGAAIVAGGVSAGLAGAGVLSSRKSKRNIFKNSGMIKISSSKKKKTLVDRMFSVLSRDSVLPYSSTAAGVMDGKIKLKDARMNIKATKMIIDGKNKGGYSFAKSAFKNKKVGIKAIKMLF